MRLTIYSVWKVNCQPTVNPEHNHTSHPGLQPYMYCCLVEDRLEEKAAVTGRPESSINNVNSSGRNTSCLTFWGVRYCKIYIFSSASTKRNCLSYDNMFYVLHVSLSPSLCGGVSSPLVRRCHRASGRRSAVGLHLHKRIKTFTEYMHECSFLNMSHIKSKLFIRASFLWVRGWLFLLFHVPYIY